MVESRKHRPTSSPAHAPHVHVGSDNPGQQSQDPCYKDPLILASFSIKGRAGKTSTALSLAGIYAAQGKKVLLADCDSQTSLTDFLFKNFEDQDRAKLPLSPRKKKLRRALLELDLEDVSEGEEHDEYSSEGEKHDDETGNFMLPFLSGDKMRATFKDYLSAQTLARDQSLSSSSADIDTIFKALDHFCQQGPASCMLPHIFPYNPDCGHNPREQIFLLAGDYRLSAFEGRLSDIPDKAGQQRVMFGLRWILHRLCKKHKIDLVIMDLGAGMHDRLQKMLLHSADVVMPFMPASCLGRFAWNSYDRWLLDVLPKFHSSWLKEASRALRLRPQQHHLDWAGELYPQQKGNRSANLSGPRFMPILATQFAMPLSLATESFLVGVQQLIKPSPSKETHLLDKAVEKAFWLGKGGQAVVAFLPNLPVFEVSHKLGVPVTLLTQKRIFKEMKRLDIRSTMDSTQSLDLIKQRYKMLANWVSIVSSHICGRSL